jgi:2-phospho-L-lactate guanylyltransferase (CobY/MobA/RfbA family)
MPRGASNGVKMVAGGSTLPASSLAFGNDSFRPHPAAVSAAGMDPQVLRFEGIGLDIDEPADLEVLARPLDVSAAVLIELLKVEDAMNCGGRMFPTALGAIFVPMLTEPRAQ